MEPTEVAVHIAELKHDVSSIVNQMEKMEAKLDQLVALDRTIAELGVHRENDANEKTALWARVDGVNKWREAHEREEAEQRARMIAALEANGKAFERSCTTIESKVDGWINKGKGAIWAASLLMGLIQTCVLAAVGWTFNHIGTLEERVIAIETRMDAHAKPAEKPLEFDYSLIKPNRK